MAWVGTCVRGTRNVEEDTRTYRPDSYSLEAMGDNSEWMLMIPSSGRSGGGFTIFASTWAITLQAKTLSTSGSTR